MKQNVLKLTLPSLMGVDDFFISPSNQDAFEMINSFWYKSFFAFNVYGPKDSGKTHLANIFKDKYNALIIKAKDISMQNFDEYFAKNKVLVIEDIEGLIDFEAMFHLYNIYKNEGGYILFTSTKPINQITTPIKDLNSRFGALAGVEIKSPDDMLLNALIVKMSYDKGLTMSPEVVSFIIKRTERSFSFIKKLVEELDLLSLERKKPISVAMAKEVISYLLDDMQPNLFK